MYTQRHGLQTSVRRKGFLRTFSLVAKPGVIAGEILPDIATLTGLPAGTPVVLGGHDHACAALALGLTRADEVVDSTGTGEGLAAVTASSHLPASLAKPIVMPVIPLRA